SYDSERIGQGRENAKTFLRENPDIAEEIEMKIRENAGLVSEKMLEGVDEEGDDDNVESIMPAEDAAEDEAKEA
ncbi:MAG: hypothetical protein ACO3MW_11300, partial [Rhodospirillales bacterium]